MRAAGVLGLVGVLAASPAGAADVGDFVVVDTGDGGKVVLQVVALQDTTPEQSEIALQAVSTAASVYVAGEVVRPGGLAWSEGLTITQAITMSGGWTRVATLRGVRVLRGGETLRVDVSDILKGRSADVALEPGDQLIVRQSPL